MKTNMLVPAIFVYAIVSLSSTPVSETVKNSVSVKPADSFSYIRCHRQGNGTAVTWGFNSSDVVSFAVQRTYQDPTDQYSMWDCVCNQPANTNRSYKYHDAFVDPGIITYKVIAYMSDGSTITSDIDQVRIVAKK